MNAKAIGRGLGAVIAAMLLLPAAAPAGDGTFTADKPDVAVKKPTLLAVGDLNADGIEDIVVGTETSGPEGAGHVRLGVGDGTFTALTGFILLPPVAIAIADFNGDGNEDLAGVARKPFNSGDFNHDDSVHIRIGEGDGTFDLIGTTVRVGEVSTAIAVADLNADGNDDFAVSNQEDDDVSIRLGKGDRTFSAAADVAVGSEPVAISAGDFDNDGKQDLAVANGGDTDVSIRIGNGDGTFASGKPDVDAGGSPTAVVTGDFNADAREDLGVLSFGGSVAIRLGGGDGTFTAKPDVGVGGSGSALALGDFDSDGNEDLVSTSPVADALSVRLGQGDGTFASLGEIAVGDLPLSVAIGDFDGDGNEDLAAANTASDDVSIRLGAGTAPLAGNLLVNGGFEGAGAMRDPIDPFPPPIAGWERNGKITAARYGMRYSSIFPDQLDSPRFLTGGLNFLFGGPEPGPGTTSAFQLVDVSGSAASIDAGLATARLSALLGGGNIYDDRMSAEASFEAAGGAELGSLEIGPVGAADRRNLSTMLPRSAERAVPAGTRRIRVTLTAINEDAGGSSAFADNVKLTLDAPAPPEPPTPPIPPKPPAPDTSLELELRGKRAQRVVKRRGVIVKLACPLEDCETKTRATARVPKLGGGRRAGAKLRLGPVGKSLVAGRPARVKLKLKRKQLRALKAALAAKQKPKFKVRATATDAAANTATKRLKVRARR